MSPAVGIPSRLHPAPWLSGRRSPCWRPVDWRNRSEVLGSWKRIYQKTNKKRREPMASPGPSHSVRRGTIIKPTACSAPAIYLPPTPHAMTDLSAFRSRGTPVCASPSIAPTNATPWMPPFAAPWCDALEDAGARSGVWARSCSPPTARPSAPGWTWPRSSQGGRHQRNQRRPRAALHRRRAPGEAADRRRPRCRRSAAAPAWWPTATSWSPGRRPPSASPKSAWACGRSWSTGPSRPRWASGGRWNLSLTGRIFGGAEARELRPGPRSWRTTPPARALKSPATVAGFSPTAIQKRDGLRPRGAGLGLGGGRRSRPRGPESGVYRARISRRGFARFGRSGGRGGRRFRNKAMTATQLLWICDTRCCGVVGQGHSQCGVGVLYFCAERV